MERQELEDLWRRRLRDAKLRLDFARSFLTEVHQSFPLDDTSSDGQFARQEALRAENVALAEYNRVLRIFTDLVIREEIPDEDQWHREAGAGDE